MQTSDGYEILWCWLKTYSGALGSLGSLGRMLFIGRQFGNLKNEYVNKELVVRVALTGEDGAHLLFAQVEN